MHRLYQLQNTNVELSLSLQQDAERARIHWGHWETLTERKTDAREESSETSPSQRKAGQGECGFILLLNLLQWIFEIWSTEYLLKELLH